jgi:hypothetical protein
VCGDHHSRIVGVRFYPHPPARFCYERVRIGVEREESRRERRTHRYLDRFASVFLTLAHTLSRVCIVR